MFNSITDLLHPDAYKALKTQTSYEGYRSFAMGKNLVRESAPCLIHGGLCPVLRAELHIAGIICVNWSPMGKSLKTDGSDHALFISWVCARRHFQESRCLSRFSIYM